MESIERKLHGGKIELKFAGSATEDQNSFTGYGAVFGNQDSYGDVIAPGAFKKSLANHKAAGTTPAMLLNHDFFSLPIGRWEDMAEDGHGLKVSGVFLDTTSGHDAYVATKAGAITGLSIGFQVTGFEMSVDKNNNAFRTITEVNLLEVSLVTFPANDQARVSDVKSVDLDGLRAAIADLASEFKSLTSKLSDDLAAKLAPDAVLKVKITKSSEDDEDERDDDEDEGEDDPLDDDDDRDDEDKSEAKYNEAAIEAVRNLCEQLKQERYGR